MKLQSFIVYPTHLLTAAKGDKSKTLSEIRQVSKVSVENLKKIDKKVL